MILASDEIRKRIFDGSGLVIRPYSDACQQPASYDLRVETAVALSPCRCTLVHSLEWVEIPADLAATLRCRSSFARRGVLVGGGFVDPGFRGQLTLALVNMGGDEIRLDPGDRVVQMILHQVAGGVHVYDGRYQDSRGVVPAR